MRRRDSALESPQSTVHGVAEPSGWERATWVPIFVLFEGEGNQRAYLASSFLFYKTRRFEKLSYGILSRSNIS